MHLMATSLGIGGYWSSQGWCKEAWESPDVKEYLNISHEDKLIGAFTIGEVDPKTKMRSTRRPIGVEFRSDWFANRGFRSWGTSPIDFVIHGNNPDNKILDRKSWKWSHFKRKKSTRKSLVVILSYFGLFWWLVTLSKQSQLWSSHHDSGFVDDWSVSHCPCASWSPICIYRQPRLVYMLKMVRFAIEKEDFKYTHCLLAESKKPGVSVVCW